MPKMKTNKAAAKRFKKRKNDLKRGQQGMTHRTGTLMTKKQKNKLKKGSTVNKNQERTIKRLIQK
jgi:large subunit ribosomal protein L35